MTSLAEKLKNFGLSEYEARALLTLLSHGTLTAKEVAELSGIPRTSVYDVMNSLLAKGFVESFGKPMKFRALNAQDIVSTISRRVSEDLEYLRRELPKVETEEVDVIRVYRGEVVLEKLLELVESAEREITAVLSYIPEKIVELLKKARCKVVVVSSNAEDVDADERYVIEGSERIIENLRVYCHGFLMFDKRKVMLVFINGTKIGILSDSRGILDFLQMLMNPLISRLKKNG